MPCTGSVLNGRRNCGGSTSRPNYLATTSKHCHRVTKHFRHFKERHFRRLIFMSVLRKHFIYFKILTWFGSTLIRDYDSIAAIVHPVWFVMLVKWRLLAIPSMLSSLIVAHRYDDVIKWKHFPRNWPFVRGIHRSPVNSPHKGQWRGALMFSLIYVWINDWVNNREAGDLRRYRAHSDVIVMSTDCLKQLMVCCSHSWLLMLESDYLSRHTWRFHFY